VTGDELGAAVAQLLPARRGPERSPGSPLPWSVLAGPDAFGRNLVVLSGGEVPDPWTSCPVVVIDDAVLRAPGPVVAVLRERALHRARSTIRLEVEFERPPDQVERRALHKLGPRFTFDLDDLYHWVWSNSVDGRWPGSRRWPPAERAIELGARAGRHADVMLPDGRDAWIDGGPLTFTEPVGGVPVIHRIALEHGSLEPFASNATTAELAPDQLAAVTHPGGAARIIAPAGSGKTRVLTERARHMIDRWGLPAAAVSLVAFNKRAQEEMRIRTSEVAGLQVRTLNAIALAIVNGSAPFAPQPRRFTTIDEIEVRRIIGSMVSFPRRRNMDPIAPWIEALSQVRLGLVDPSVVERRYDGDVDGFAERYPHYRLALDRRSVVDFDEQIHRALEVLLSDPVARRAAQRASRSLLVDEFQDLTPAHVLLVRLLAGAACDVFGVGDDDQTIYGYNGADPAWLIDFADLFPGAGDHPLEVNYRCPDGIVTAADRLLRHNQRRVAKTIRGVRPGEVGWEASTEADTVARTVEVIAESVASGRSADDVVVLTRVNSMLAPVQVALDEAGVPRRGGVGPEFAERTAVRAALAWLRLGCGGTPWQPGDLDEALRRPSRSLHPRIGSWVAEQTDLGGLRRLAGRVQNERDAERIGAFADDVERMAQLAARGGTTADLLGELRDSVGLGGAVATLDQSRHGMNRAAQNDDLTAVIQLGRLQPDPVHFPTWLAEQLRRRPHAAGVTLSTVHRVKGQEWGLVVVHQADADQFPHRLADDVEEERRLFHVAITRAIDRAVIVSGRRPSPFVAELSTEPSIVPRGSPGAGFARGSASDRRSGRRDDHVTPVPKVAASKRPAEQLTGVPALAEERLRTLRKERAAGRPAYVVFDDATMARIALALPTSVRELSSIHGIGPRKIELYGEAILEAVAAAIAIGLGSTPDP